MTGQGVVPVSTPDRGFAGFQVGDGGDGLLVGAGIGPGDSTPGRAKRRAIHQLEAMGYRVTLEARPERS